MEFFTADDVLTHITAATPDDPVTVQLDDSIQKALLLMLEHDFDQLPVVCDHDVEGTVTYKSVAKYVKSMDAPRVEEACVKIALKTNPCFVDREPISSNSSIHSQRIPSSWWGTGITWRES